MRPAALTLLLLAASTYALGSHDRKPLQAFADATATASAFGSGVAQAFAAAASSADASGDASASALAKAVATASSSGNFGSSAQAAASSWAQAAQQGGASAEAAAKAAAEVIGRGAVQAKAVAAAVAKAFLLPNTDKEACKRVWILTLTDAICLYPVETGYAIAVAFSDALAYDRATCGKTCKSSEFALATAEALAEAVDKCGCDAAATSLAIAVAELGPDQAHDFLEALTLAAYLSNITLPPCIFPISCVYVAPVIVAFVCKVPIPVLVEKCNVQPKVVIICGKAGLPVTPQQAVAQASAAATASAQASATASAAASAAAEASVSGAAAKASAVAAAEAAAKAADLPAFVQARASAQAAALSTSDGGASAAATAAAAAQSSGSDSSTTSSTGATQLAQQAAQQPKQATSQQPRQAASQQPTQAVAPIQVPQLIQIPTASVQPPVDRSQGQRQQPDDDQQPGDRSSQQSQRQQSVAIPSQDQQSGNAQGQPSDAEVKSFCTLACTVQWQAAAAAGRTSLTVDEDQKAINDKASGDSGKTISCDLSADYCADPSKRGQSSARSSRSSADVSGQFKNIAG